MDVDDFQISATPDIEVKVKNKKNKKSKLVLNESCETLDESAVKPKWNDDHLTHDVGEIYDCLDITKILKSDNDKAIQIKSFSVLSGDRILAPGFLDFFRCSDANRDYPGRKYVSLAIFHPQKQCIIVADKEGTFCLFKVDGEQNDGLCKPIYIEQFPIKGGTLLPNGRHLVFISKRYFFKVFDLTTMQSAHYAIDKSCTIERIAASPTGLYFVVASHNSTIHVLSTRSFQVVHKMVVSGAVRSLAFSHGGKYLYALEEQGKISVFEFRDNGKPIFIRHWYDEGCIKGLCIAISGNDSYVACGSHGNMNLYHLNDTWKTEYPAPIKSISYLETRVNQLLFNNSSELLAIGYCFNADMNTGLYKLLHLGSFTIFSNFPDTKSKVRPTSLSFSPNDKYLAVGQYNGKVTLMNLKYYNKY